MLARALQSRRDGGGRGQRDGRLGAEEQGVGELLLPLAQGSRRLLLLLLLRGQVAGAAAGVTGAQRAGSAKNRQRCCRSKV